MGCLPGVFGILGGFGLSGVISGLVSGQIWAVYRAESGGIWPMYGHRFSGKGVNGREGVL